MLFFLFINVKMPTVVGILTFMSRKNFMLNGVEHEKSFITSGPDLALFGNHILAPKLVSERRTVWAVYKQSDCSLSLRAKLMKTNNTIS